MNIIKKFLFLIVTFLSLSLLCVNAEPAKIMSVNYDDSASLVFINSENISETDTNIPKYIRLSSPNRIYFDINNAVLSGPKQQLVFENSTITEIKLAQFSTNPDVVRVVISFEEDYDTSKIKIFNINGKYIISAQPPILRNDYFNPVYDEEPESIPYSGITVSSQVIQKTNINPSNTTPSDKVGASVMNDIYKAFADSSLNNSDGKTYDSIVSIDMSSDLKLRTKYYINGYYLKNDGLLVSGLGQMTAAKIFTLDSPKRIVIDLPNSYVDKKIRNKEINLCSDMSCSDTAKIGQFEYNKARIVVNTEKTDKYIPVYSEDNQSLLFINADKLNHTALSDTTANISKVYTKKVNPKTNELILSFTSPVVHSIVRKDGFLTLYLFNVKSYNEPDIIKTLNNTYFKNSTFSLLPQIGVKTDIKIKRDDVVQVAQGVDGKALKITINSKFGINKNEPEVVENTPIAKKPPIKNKVVIDPGHGGSDYGAIREGINEKDITLDISKKVASYLKSKGFKPVLTRTDDTFLELQERCDITDNENPEIFVSIHVNSAVATEPYGIETHYYHENSKELAEIIQKHMISNINSKDRGVIKSKFYVINHTDVPAVLVEIGFLSNPEERTDIMSEKRKQATVKAISDGIAEYLKGKK